MSTSELFDMDCASPVASTSAHQVAQRFLVDYAPPTHLKPITVDRQPAPRRVKSPVTSTQTQTTTSYISGDDSERIRRWLLATHQALVQQQQISIEKEKAKSAFSDSEEEESDEDSQSSCSSENDSESDSDRIFLQPRRHQQSSSSLPPHPRQGAQAHSSSPAPAAGKSKSQSPLPVFPRRKTAPGSVTAMMMSHLTAARPALPVVCLSAASGQVDITPSTSSHSQSPSHSRSGSRDQPCRSRWSSSCSIQQPRSQPSWYEDDEDDSLNVPALVEDDECAPASTSTTRSIPIPIVSATAGAVPRRARPQAQGRGRPTQRNPIEFGNADTAKFGQSAFDDDTEDEDEYESEDEEVIVEEEQWDEDYQSPPRRRALNAAKGHMDGQSFYNGWLSQYHNQAMVADDRA